MRYNQDDNIQEFSDGLDSVLKEAHGKSIVLVMGAENSGKNTFVNQLLGVQYSVQTNPRTRQDYFAISKENTAIALKKIGHIHNYMPELFNAEQDGMTYCVCPDLVNPGAGNDEKEKLNVSLPMTLQAAKGIKSIVFLFNIITLQHSRGIEFRRLVASFVKLFKNESFIYSNRNDMPSMFYVFTKVDRGINIDNIKVTMFELLSTIDLEIRELMDLKSNLEAAQKESGDEFKYASEIMSNDVLCAAKNAEKRMIVAVVNDISRIFISYNDANVHEQLQVLKDKLIRSPVIHSSQLLNNIDIRNTFLNKHVKKMIELKNDWDRHHTKLKFLQETKCLNEAQKARCEGTAHDNELYLRMLNDKIDKNRSEYDKLVRSCNELDTEEAVEHCTLEGKIERSSFNQAMLNITVYLCCMGIKEEQIDATLQQLVSQGVAADQPPQGYVINAVSDFVLKNLPIQIKLLKYNGIPFCDIEKSTTDGTQFNSDEVSIPEQGKYSISYSPLIDGTATIKFYVHKKILNSDKIKNFKEKIDSLDSLYETYIKEKNIFISDPRFRHDIDEISAKLRDCTVDVLKTENELVNMKLHNAIYITSIYNLSKLLDHVVELCDLQKYSRIIAGNFGISIDEADTTLDDTTEVATADSRIIETNLDVVADKNDFAGDSLLDETMEDAPSLGMR